MQWFIQGRAAKLILIARKKYLLLINLQTRTIPRGLYNQSFTYKMYLGILILLDGLKLFYRHHQNAWSKRKSLRESQNTSNAIRKCRYEIKYEFQLGLQWWVTKIRLKMFKLIQAGVSEQTISLFFAKVIWFTKAKSYWFL